MGVEARQRIKIIIVNKVHTPIEKGQLVLVVFSKTKQSFSLVAQASHLNQNRRKLSFRNNCVTPKPVGIMNIELDTIWIQNMYILFLYCVWLGH